MAKFTILSDAIKAFASSEEAAKLPACVRDLILVNKNCKFSDTSYDMLATEFDCYKANAINENDDVFNRNVFELIRNAYMTDCYGNSSEEMGNTMIAKEDAIGVCKEFLSANNGDNATENLILSIFAELLDCSPDTILELIS